MSSPRMRKITPAQIILIGFFLLILTGAILLTLPISSRSGEFTPFSDALFTATSATCVTGLVVYDTYQHWTFFGQFVIMMLIQIGGMGVVTMAIAIFVITGKKIGFKQRFVMQESISAPQMGGIVRMTGFIIRGTLTIEGIGALIMACRFVPQFGLEGIWYSIFHAVSAFCNAGFDLLGREAPFTSITNYTGDPLINLPIILLITIGGLGFFVWKDIQTNGLKFRQYRLHTKLVLVTSLCLVVIPTLFFFFVEFSRPEWASMTLGERFWASLFQTVTPRTAGFNSVDLTKLQGTSVLILTLLMLIGGSPGSTAGGFKTTSLSVAFLCVFSVFRKKSGVSGFHRRISSDTLRDAVTILTLFATLFFAASIAICCIDSVTMEESLFECASAIGTVGLTLGITPDLSLPSHLILIGLMYFGRVGGLTILFAMSSGTNPAPSQMPQEKISVG